MFWHGSLDGPRREHLPTTSWWTRPGAQAPCFCRDWPGCRTLWWGDGGFCAAAWTQGRAALRGASNLQRFPADTIQAGTQLKAVYTALPQGRVGTGVNGEAEKRDPSPLCHPLPCHTPPVPWSPETAPQEAPSEPMSQTGFLLDAAPPGGVRQEPYKWAPGTDPPASTGAAAGSPEGRQC